MCNDRLEASARWLDAGEDGIFTCINGNSDNRENKAMKTMVRFGGNVCTSRVGREVVFEGSLRSKE